ncbi:hypothetical protein SAMN02745784_01793 [Tissierella praeacuta DSM 18095]|uniref:Uncharacterized protein n=1 Tax=Tissierella praeacuta DSM 18095 TaxID=1123404 RepID=A0A1M4W8F1_9FIRM|nr:hypothetical protein [Tissierella praeacuta]SHE77534.1 hypothetical protein SAMN02745784_01793 [Tissierella praeacuta DSM 18095]SUO99973.1 Uncharacterised protein [Tissierella praeacuta]
MKFKRFKFIILFSIALILFPSLVYANSSWHWLTTSPLTVLPFAIIFTLLIETIMVIKVGKVRNYKKTFIIVSLANLISFLVPYINRAYMFIPISGDYALLDAFHAGPFYIVLVGYLLLTVLVEFPVVYLLLRKDCENEKDLNKAILYSNIITTVLVGICERIICIGKW